MTINNLLLCFLVATPAAGITLSGQPKAQMDQKAHPARHINWDPKCEQTPKGRGGCGNREGAEVAGIMDMGYVMTFLVALGKEYNATVHMKGGANGAHLHLEPRHSKYVNHAWSHYFDTSANDGNPYHELYQGSECKEIWDTNVDFKHLFKKGETCLTFRARFGHYHNTHAKELIKKYKPQLPYSREVNMAAGRILGELPENYGVIHVRRCDRLVTNRKCTAVNTITEKVKSLKEPVDKWVVFSYAEDGYDEELASNLELMGHKTVFEKELAAKLNPKEDDDNYFTYRVSQQVMENAAVLLNYHNCLTNNGHAFMRKPLKGNLKVESSTQSEYIMGMQSDMAESKAICTWKPGDGLAPMPGNSLPSAFEKVKRK